MFKEILFLLKSEPKFHNIRMNCARNAGTQAVFIETSSSTVTKFLELPAFVNVY